MSGVSDLRLLLSRATAVDRSEIPAPNTIFISTTVKKTLDIMLKLKESSTAADFISHVIGLRDLVDKDDALLCMEDYQPHRFVIDFLPRFKGDLEVEKEAFTLLIRQSKRSGKLRRGIQSSQTLMRFLLDSCVARLTTMAEYDEHLDTGLTLLTSIMIQGCHSGLVSDSDQLCHLVREALFTGPSSLVVNSAKILATFRPKDHHFDEFVVENAERFARLVECNMTSQTVVVCLCSFLDNTVYNSVHSFRVQHSGKAVAALMKFNLHGLLMDAIVDNLVSNSPAHLSSVLSLLTTLTVATSASFPKDRNWLVFQDALKDAVMKFPEDLSVHTYGIKLFFTTLGFLARQEALPKLDESWLRVIYKAMAAFRDSAMVSEWGCKALVLLFLLRSDLLRFVGDEVTENRDSLHTCILGVLLMEGVRDSIPAVCSACDAIFVISAQSPRLQHQFMLKNSHLAVIAVMSKHCNSVFVQRSAVRALRGVGIFSQSNQQELYRDDVLERFYDLFERFYNNSEVLNEAIITLTSLADFDAVKHQLVLEISLDNAFNLSRIMNKFLTTQSIQEASLECLCVLASAEGATYALYSAGVLKICLQVAAIHPNSYRIQKHVLIFNQLLAPEINCNDLDLVNTITDCISSAMTTFQLALGVQAEGCVTIQLLAERNNNFGQIFLEKRLYECVFRILETFSDRDDIYNLAAECIYIIVCERHLKSKVLMEAIAHGQVKVVLCLLELGASPNGNPNEDSPLLSAVRFNDEPRALQMIKCLLDKGANELMTALDMAIYKQYYRITGLLLKRLGFDSRQENRILTWCNLKLIDFKVEWLHELITSRDTAEDIFRISMKKLARKIQNCQEIRTDRRLAYDFVSSKKLPLRYPSIERYRPKSDSLESIQEDNEACISPPRRAAPLLGLDEGFLAGEFASGSLMTSTPVPHCLPARRKRSKPFATVENRRQSAKVGSPVPWMTSTRVGKDRPTLSRRISLDPGAMGHDKYLSEGDLVNSGNSDRNVEETRVMFTHLRGEIDEFYRSSLSGANIPFSLKDPRRGNNRSIAMLEERLLKASSKQFGSRNSLLEVEDGVLSLTKRSLSSYLNVVGVPAELPFVELVPQTENTMTPILERLDETASSVDSEISISFDDNGLGIIVEKSADIDDEHSSTLQSGPKPLRSISNITRTSSTRKSRPTHSNLSSQLEITTVDFSSNGMISLDAFVQVHRYHRLLAIFANLVQLNISHNKLERVPREVWTSLPKLTHLDLNDNRLSNFPYSVLVFCPIISIDVSDNQIAEIGLKEEEVDQISHVSLTLKIFKVARNCLTEFPVSLVGNLFCLEELTFQGNKLRELPESSFRLKRLKILNLANNYIKMVPEDFLGEFPNLVTLDLACNELESLPSVNVVDKLPNLGILKLAHNVLATKEPFYIPQFILRLVSLRYLDLSNNQLSGIASPEKWSSRNLRELILADNQISFLELTNVKDHWAILERLSLSHNKLKKLPAEIGRLSNLTSLNISYNPEITSLPDELGLLVGKLWDFPTDGIRLNLDEALLRGPRKNLLGYLHNRHKKSVEYYGLKLMMVGYGGKGKTSLLRALMKERTTKDSRQNIATVGINVTLWRYPCRHKGKAVEYQLSSWDFAGQEEFYSTHQCFLSQRAVYLVVYDLRNREEELKCLEPWLLNIKAQAPKCPVIVVGTHLDNIRERDRRQVCTELRHKIQGKCMSANFPRISEFAEVDARRDNFTVEELRVKMLRVIEEFAINNEPVMGQKIPASFVRLEGIIRGRASSLPLENPILHHQQILKILKDDKLDMDDNELQQAIRFLHDAGVLLHFDDPILQLNHLYFVDPQWLCRMMAQVITVRDINPFVIDGIMRTEALPLVFTGKRITENNRTFVFPTQQIPYFLRLLQKFEVTLPETNGEILIPSRLPENKPEISEISSIDEALGNIRRMYAMAFLPTGMWPRLIARLRTLKDTIFEELTHQSDQASKTKLWRRGFFVMWNQETYFLVEGWYDKQQNYLQIQVPRSKLGTKLLVQIVDCVDVLIEEWFPGLQECDLTGTPLLQRLVQCPFCSEPDPHVFPMEEILAAAELEDSIVCPRHLDRHPEVEKIPLVRLAPDVLLADLDPEFHLEADKLELLQTQEFLLGRGSFGAVYRATYKDQPCAVKVFSNNASEIPIYRLLRQEVEILRRLQHPSLLQLLAVERRFLVLELAPMGSLDALLDQNRVRGRRLIHRIVLQITEGLCFLHSHKIIYRDIKPDNVLVYSLSAERSVINVKLSDYGISRLITPYGFVIPEGTEGYMAPEVIRNQVYDLSADMYSLGILFYAIVTNGRHPFDELAKQGQFSEAILIGRRSDPITKKGCQPWPDMQELVDHCLYWTPSKRPTSLQVLDKLKGIDFLTLHRAIPVSKNANIDCMSVRVNENNHMEICTASGDEHFVQVTWNDVTAGKSKGLILRDQRVLCMTLLSSHVLFGTQSGRIWVYEIQTNKCLHAIEQMKDAVLCITYYRTSNHGKYILVGLANGELAIFDRSELIQSPQATMKYVKVDESPVRTICTHDGRGYVGCGPIVYSLKKLQEVDRFSIKKIIDVTKTDRNRKNLINCLIVRHSSVFISKWGGNKVYHYDIDGTCISEPYDIHKLIQQHCKKVIPPEDCRVTCLLLWNGNRRLAVGTGGGFFVVIDINDKQGVVITRHTGAIRAIDHINLKTSRGGDSNTAESSVLSTRCLLRSRILDSSFMDGQNGSKTDILSSCIIVSGLGFTNTLFGKDDNYAYLTIWQDDILEEDRYLTRDIANRAELMKDTPIRTY